MTTAARPTENGHSHWYCPKTREPRHFVPRKDGNGNRPATLRDARENGWVPSVTTILRCLDKPGLNNWRVEQGILAALTTPRRADENLDAFVKRVLTEDAEAEGQKARDLGSDIHAGIAAVLQGELSEPATSAYVIPAVTHLNTLGRCTLAEEIVFGAGYAGCLDLLLENDREILVVDVKTTSAKDLPKSSWPEHKLQLAAYASTLGNTGNLPISTLNLYVSTREPGKIQVCRNDDWQECFQNGFLPLLHVWQWMNRL